MLLIPLGTQVNHVAYPMRLKEVFGPSLDGPKHSAVDLIQELSAK